MPSDDDYRPNQHPSDGKQARSAHGVQAVGQLWPNEIQKQALGEGIGGSSCLGDRKGVWCWGQNIWTDRAFPRISSPA